MKKLAWVSGVFAALLLSLLLTGVTDTDAAVKGALLEGNEWFASGGYAEALRAYEAGLAVSPEDEALRFNAAQAAYALGEYEKAIEHYGIAGESLPKFLSCGNAGYYLAEAATDPIQKMEHYAQALQAYRAGIERFPEDVPLKYNYETVRALMDELSEEMEQEGEGQDEGDQGQDESESESGGEQSQEQESEEADSAQQEQASEEDEGSASEQDEGKEDGEQQSNAEGEDEGEQEREAIARILEALESQEEESLKNNQGVVGGKEGTNGW